MAALINKKASNINNLIVCGDFNCCLRDNDRSTATHLKDKSRRSFSELIKNLQLIDHWDSRGTKISNFTWTDGKIYSRLDYILTNINNDIKIIKTYSETVIDDRIGTRTTYHKAICIEVEIMELDKGPGY